jgi:diacylglycerol kinase family enzyme
MDELSSVSRETPAIVFVNPSAGGGRAQGYLPRIKNLFAARQFHAEFVFTSSLEELESRTRAAIAAERRVLFAVGGDGTLQGLVNAAHGSNAVLGILPAGGGNDFAAALGIPKNPLAAVEVILDGQPRVVDLLRARTADGRERLYVGGGGVGLDANAARYAASYHRVPGRLRNVLVALRPARIQATDCACAIPQQRIVPDRAESVGRGGAEHPNIRRGNPPRAYGANR